MDRDTRDAVIGAIAEVAGLDTEDVRPESNLVEDLRLDSLDFAKLEQEIQGRLEIEVDARAFQGIDTVQQLLNKVDSITADAG